MAPDSGKHGTATTTDLLGSARATIRGTVAGVVSASGKLTFAFKGKSVNWSRPRDCRTIYSIAEARAENGDK